MFVDELPCKLLRIHVVNIHGSMVCHRAKGLFHEVRKLNFIDGSSIPAICLNLDSRELIDILSHPRCVCSILWVKNRLCPIQANDATPVARGKALVVGI